MAQPMPAWQQTMGNDAWCWSEDIALVEMYVTNGKMASMYICMVHMFFIQTMNTFGVL